MWSAWACVARTNRSRGGRTSSSSDRIDVVSSVPQSTMPIVLSGKTRATAFPLPFWTRRTSRRVDVKAEAPAPVSEVGGGASAKPYFREDGQWKGASLCR